MQVSEVMRAVAAGRGPDAKIEEVMSREVMYCISTPGGMHSQTSTGSTQSTRH